MKTVEKLRIAPIGTIVNFADRTLIIKRFRAIVRVNGNLSRMRFP